MRLQYLRQITEQDHEYQQLLHYIRNGFPDHRSQLPDGCKRYWNILSQLALDEDLIVYGCRLLIPVKMRSKVLTQLHESHQGSVRTKQRARLVVYWPGMDNDIDEVILKCKQCQEKLPSQPREPIIRPNRPFQEIAADFCSYAANDFLILVLRLARHHPHGPQYHYTPTQHPNSSPLSRNRSAAQGHQILSGPIKGLSSLRNCSKTSPKSGGFNTSHLPPLTHRAMAKSRPP